MLKKTLIKIAELLPETFDIKVITYIHITKEMAIEGYENNDLKIKKLLIFGETGTLRRKFDRNVKEIDEVKTAIKGDDNDEDRKNKGEA